MKTFVLLCFLLAGCSNIQDQPYWLANTDLKCDAVIVTGKKPLIDPVMAYQVCEDREGRLYFPNGLIPNASIGSAAGLVSAVVGQAAAVGAMMGGF